MYIQKRKEQLQSSLVDASGGRGRTKKMKAFDRIKNYEHNFVTTHNHLYSKKIIDVALENNCGTINIELLDGIARDEKSKWILRNWSYFQLITFIKQKANKYDIQVQTIDPYHTSVTCSICGSEGKHQRKEQSLFVCDNPSCDNHKGINADINAAFNIANSNKLVESKKDCQFYKLRYKK